MTASITTTPKFNLSSIMKAAWTTFRAFKAAGYATFSFSDALKAAWAEVKALVTPTPIIAPIMTPEPQDFAALLDACTAAARGFSGHAAVAGWTATGAFNAAKAAKAAAAEATGEMQADLIEAANRAAKAAAKGYNRSGLISKQNECFAFMAA